MLACAAGSKNGKENAHRNLPAALAGENSKSLIRPSSAKRKLDKMGSLKQSTLPFAKKPSTGGPTKLSTETAAKPEAQPAAKSAAAARPVPADDNDDPIVID